jgi:hypothetical protein
MPRSAATRLRGKPLVSAIRTASRKLSDGGGLYLLVTAAGERCWRMDYRFAEKRATAALGIYPTITLAEARAQRLEIKKQIAQSVGLPVWLA